MAEETKDAWCSETEYEVEGFQSVQERPEVWPVRYYETVDHECIAKEQYRKIRRTPMGMGNEESHSALEERIRNRETQSVKRETECVSLLTGRFIHLENVKHNGASAQALVLRMGQGLGHREGTPIQNWETLCIEWDAAWKKGMVMELIELVEQMEMYDGVKEWFFRKRECLVSELREQQQKALGVKKNT